VVQCFRGIGELALACTRRSLMPPWIMRLLALLFAATALTAQEPVDFPGWFTRGVQEFQAARYPGAAAAFERAVSIDPSNVSAQLYLGTAYMQQYIPGNESPANLRLAEAAQAHFLKVLNLDGSNTVALASIASLFLNQKKWDEAQQWYQKLTVTDPSNADAYYSMGFIAWSRWYPAYGKARDALGMKPQDPGPLQDAGVRTELKTAYGTVIESGLRALEKALEINPQYADAMAYTNLLIRERADLRDTQEEYRLDVATADEWVRKALAAKKAEVERRNAIATVNSQTAPSRIQISGDVVERKRLRDVPPVYPELAKQAGIQGAVRLNIVIDKQGRVSDIKVISGHPLLIPAALDAVKQWEFSPTLLNGQAVEVFTEVSIPFVL
jgi:TonB family protein